MTAGILSFQPLEFLGDVAAQPETGACVDWPWPERTTREGYGRFSIPGVGSVRATHIVLDLAGRPRPEAPANHALHSCDRPACIAPWHLRWGTQRENNADRMSRRGPSIMAGERNGRAVLTQAQVATIRARVAGGDSQRSMARRFGVHHSVVQQIIRGELWPG